MLSKEEIEKAKKEVKPLSIGDFVTWFTTDGIIKKGIAIKTLLQYINQLEQENSKKDKIIDEMAEQLSGLTILDIKKDEYIVLGDKEEVKKYFEKKIMKG